MSAYREAGGTPCPRCETPLLHEHAGELRCGNGCGTWVGNARLPVDPASLRQISRGNPFRAQALPFTRCLECKLSLNDLYQGDRDVLVLGQCLEHGVWLERADLTAFEAHYPEAIARARKLREEVDAMRAREDERRQRDAAEQARRERQREREERELALLPIPDLVQQLVQRITRLEARVAELERELKRRDD